MASLEKGSIVQIIGGNPKYQGKTGVLYSVVKVGGGGNLTYYGLIVPSLVGTPGLKTHNLGDPQKDANNFWANGPLKGTPYENMGVWVGNASFLKPVQGDELDNVEDAILSIQGYVLGGTTGITKKLHLLSGAVPDVPFGTLVQVKPDGSSYQFSVPGYEASLGKQWFADAVVHEPYGFHIASHVHLNVPMGGHPVGEYVVIGYTTDGSIQLVKEGVAPNSLNGAFIVKWENVSKAAPLVPVENVGVSPGKTYYVKATPNVPYPDEVASIANPYLTAAGHVQISTQHGTGVVEPSALALAINKPAWLTKNLIGAGLKIGDMVTLLYEFNSFAGASSYKAQTKTGIIVTVPGNAFTFSEPKPPEFDVGAHVALSDFHGVVTSKFVGGDYVKAFSKLGALKENEPLYIVAFDHPLSGAAAATLALTTPVFNEEYGANAHTWMVPHHLLKLQHGEPAYIGLGGKALKRLHTLGALGPVASFKHFPPEKMGSFQKGQTASIIVKGAAGDWKAYVGTVSFPYVNTVKVTTGTHSIEAMLDEAEIGLQMYQAWHQLIGLGVPPHVLNSTLPIKSGENVVLVTIEGYQASPAGGAFVLKSSTGEIKHANADTLAAAYLEANAPKSAKAKSAKSAAKDEEGSAQGTANVLDLIAFQNAVLKASALDHPELEKLKAQVEKPKKNAKAKAIILSPSEEMEAFTFLLDKRDEAHDILTHFKPLTENGLELSEDPDAKEIHLPVAAVEGIEKVMKESIAYGVEKGVPQALIDHTQAIFDATMESLAMQPVKDGKYVMPIPVSNAIQGNYIPWKLKKVNANQIGAKAAALAAKQDAIAYKNNIGLDAVINMGIHEMAKHFTKPGAPLFGCILDASMAGEKLDKAASSFCSGVSWAKPKQVVKDGKTLSLYNAMVLKGGHGGVRVEMKLGAHSSHVELSWGSDKSGKEGVKLHDMNWLQGDSTASYAKLRSVFMAQMVKRAWPDAEIEWASQNGGGGFTVTKMPDTAADPAKVRAIAHAMSMCKDLDLGFGGASGNVGGMQVAALMGIIQGKAVGDLAWAVRGYKGLPDHVSVSPIAGSPTEQSTPTTIKGLKALISKAPLAPLFKGVKKVDGIEVIEDKSDAELLAMGAELGITPVQPHELPKLKAYIDKFHTGLKTGNGAESASVFADWEEPWAPGIIKGAKPSTLVKEPFWVGRRLRVAHNLPLLGLKKDAEGVVVDIFMAPSAGDPDIAEPYACIAFPKGTVQPEGKKVEDVVVTCNGMIDPLKGDAVMLPAKMLVPTPDENGKKVPASAPAPSQFKVGSPVYLKGATAKSSSVYQHLVAEGITGVGKKYATPGDVKGLVVGEESNYVCVAFEDVATTPPNPGATANFGYLCGGKLPKGFRAAYAVGQGRVIKGAKQNPLFGQKAGYH